MQQLLFLVIVALVGINGALARVYPTDDNEDIEYITSTAPPQNHAAEHKPAHPQPKLGYSHGLDIIVGYMEQYHEHQPLGSEHEGLHGLNDTAFLEKFAALAVREVVQRLDDHHNEDDVTKGQEHVKKHPAPAPIDLHIQYYHNSYPPTGALKDTTEKNPPPKSPEEKQSWLSSYFWGWQ